jgi:hypothetical protein
VSRACNSRQARAVLESDLVNWGEGEYYNTRMWKPIVKDAGRAVRTPGMGRRSVARELVEQVRNASRDQVCAYWAHRTRHINRWW